MLAAMPVETFAAARKVHKMVELSGAMGNDAAFVRQARRKILGPK